VYEELWHGEALSRFLGEAGVRLDGDSPVGWDDPYPSRVDRVARVRRRSGASGWRRPVAMFAGSLLFRDFPAVHMTWGAVNELSTLTAYRRLIARTRHPVLADLLRRIVRDERRHYSFYRGEAQRRLAQSRTARRITRVALDRWWAIVGTGVRPQAETDFVVLYLFGDDEGRRAGRAMDSTVESLPGLAGLRLFERAWEDAHRRAARSASPKPDSQSVEGLGRDRVPAEGEVLRRKVPVVPAQQDGQERQHEERRVLQPEALVPGGGRRALGDEGERVGAVLGAARREPLGVEPLRLAVDARVDVAEP
jgi:hypothetical protein